MTKKEFVLFPELKRLRKEDHGDPELESTLGNME
jgi:hypothetical protein